MRPTTVVVVVMIVALLTGTVPVSAQVEPETKRFSPPLAVLGGIAVLIGGMLLVPWPEADSKDVHILGAEYCSVTTATKISVRAGSCSVTGPFYTAAAITMGAGALMTAIGLAKVRVRPSIGHKAVGATATIQW